MAVDQADESKAETVYIVACRFLVHSTNCNEWPGKYGYVVLCHRGVRWHSG